MRRTYRRLMTAADLKYWSVRVGETDLRVGLPSDVQVPNPTKLVSDLVRGVRADLASHLTVDPRFQTSFTPRPAPPDAPAVVQAMAAAAELAGVGPMAAVAGAIAEHVGRELLEQTGAGEVLVENGGDVWLLTRRSRIVAVVVAPGQAGQLGLVIPAGCRISVCTSSGTVGPSVSLGHADAVTVAAEDGAVADALATAGGNRIQGPNDIEATLTWIAGCRGVRGAVIVAGEAVGIKGSLELAVIGS